MLFIEWWIVRRFIILIMAIALCSGFIWAVRKKRKWIRIPVTLLGSPIVILAALALGLQVLALGCLTYSAPVYSPNHEEAARVRTDDEGATGGNSHVDVFRHHGLVSQEVFWGQWKSVGPEDIHWISDSELEIRQDGPAYSCEGMPSIKVTCITKPLSSK